MSIWVLPDGAIVEARSHALFASEFGLTVREAIKAGWIRVMDDKVIIQVEDARDENILSLMEMAYWEVLGAPHPAPVEIESYKPRQVDFLIWKRNVDDLGFKEAVLLALKQALVLKKNNGAVGIGNRKTSHRTKQR